MYYSIIALALIALGFIFLFFVDNIIVPSTQNTILKTIRDNNILIAVACMGLGYYVYTLSEKQNLLKRGKLIEVSDVEHLPSYDESSMSTDAVLKM